MICINCQSDEIYMIDGYETCTSCGQIDTSTVQLITEFIKEGSRLHYKKKVFYERLNYFTHILNLITCEYILYNKKILKLVDIIKKTKNKYTLHELKDWLKSNKYNRYVKYIYIIYYKVYDKKLIRLNNQEYYKVLYEFKQIDRLYNKKTKKRNQMNYYFIIFKLFQKLHIETIHLLLPKTINSLEQTYNLLC